MTSIKFDSNIVDGCYYMDGTLQKRTILITHFYRLS